LDLKQEINQLKWKELILGENFANQFNFIPFFP